ncbi:hypothetical protein [Spirillospora sp. CA-128828]|uniref:hypothetical protein n=1 Tax=Spirillospora sp. CA-128828 TaxID=3240033 RepID=UPI003D8D2813
MNDPEHQDYRDKVIELDGSLEGFKDLVMDSGLCTPEAYLWIRQQGPTIEQIGSDLVEAVECWGRWAMPDGDLTEEEARQDLLDLFEIH